MPVHSVLVSSSNPSHSEDSAELEHPNREECLPFRLLSPCKTSVAEEKDGRGGSKIDRFGVGDMHGDEGSVEGGVEDL